MGEHKQVKVDPKEIQQAQTMWINFVQGGKYSIILITAILVLMALAFVQF